MQIAAGFIALGFISAASLTFERENLFVLSKKIAISALSTSFA